MKALNELRRMIVTPSRIKQGVVVDKFPTTIVVSSEDGRVELYVPNVSQFPLGSLIRYKDGVVVGFSSTIENLPVYYV